MNISQNKNNINFNARLIATIESNLSKNKQNIELYSLDKNDKNFVKKMVTKIDLMKMYPNQESYSGFVEWKNLITNATQRVGDFNAVLATKNKKPCGIMIYSKDQDEIYLNYLTRWNTKPNDELPNIGKILMRHLFNIADKEQIYKILLRPAECKPRGKSCKTFYKNLGFKEDIDGQYKMDNVNFFMKGAQLENFFNYKEVKNAKNIKANKIFNLSFYGTFCEKFSQILNNIYQKLGL